MRSISAVVLLVLSVCAPIAAQDTGDKPGQALTPAVDVKTVRAGMPESWEVLRVPGKDRPLIDAEPLTEDHHPGFTRELVRVQWREGDGIDLWVIKPAGVKNPPVVLYLFSYPSTNDRYQDLEFCQFLTRNGVAAVGFVSALTGQRYHDRPMKEWFISNLQESLATTVHDVQMILDYLAKRGDLNMDRVGMFGDGSGASIAIMAAAADPRIKALDLLNPWGDWPDWLAKSSLVPEDERPSYLKPEFSKKIEGLDPVKWFPELRSRAVRLQYIRDGISVTPNTAKERIEAAAPPNAKIVRYQNSKEFFRIVASSGTGFDWIKEQVSGLPAASETKTADRVPVAGNKSHHND